MSKEGDEEIYKNNLDSKDNNGETKITDAVEAIPESGLGLGVMNTQEDRKNQQINASIPDDLGWKTIPQKDVPSEWLYNDPYDKLKIKAADFEHIRHYSMMNEEDPNNVDDRINEILRHNCKVGNGSYEKLCITDKLHVFFLIRDWTMMNSKANNKIMMSFTNKRGETAKREVNSDIFEYFSMPKSVMAVYDAQRRCFVFQDSTITNSEKEITVCVPKVGTINKMKDYIRHVNNKKQQGDNNAYLDTNFIVYAQYMVEDASLIDDDFKYVEKLRKIFTDYTPVELQVFDKLVSRLKLGVKPTAKVSFPDGSSEVFPMNFREYKSLFYLSDKLGALFGDD